MSQQLPKKGKTKGESTVILYKGIFLFPNRFKTQLAVVRMTFPAGLSLPIPKLHNVNTLTENLLPLDVPKYEHELKGIIISIAIIKLFGKS